MRRIVAVTSCPTGIAHTMMAAEALRAEAVQRSWEIEVETQGSVGKRGTLTEEAIDAADVVILATDIRIDAARFLHKPIYETTTAEAIRHTGQVLDAAIALAPAEEIEAPPAIATPVAASEITSAPEPKPTSEGKVLVGITSCPTGIAHTFMAAEALNKAAKSLGYTMKVETQGSVGAKNTLTPEDIAAADAVVIAADTKVDVSRFAGKRLYMTGTKDAMHHGPDVIRIALEQPIASASMTLDEKVEEAKAARSASRTGPYKHLMTGVSYMLPLLVAGGLCIALAFATGGIVNPEVGYPEGSLPHALHKIGDKTAFSLFVAVLSAFIAYSIADRPGIAPGLIGGMLAQSLEAGFLGGILSGFLAGYLTLFLAEKIRLPVHLEGLKPVLILPFLSTIIVGLAMIYVISPPVKEILSGMTVWLNSMRGANAIVLGLVLGAMMAFDMGGPINKAAYLFATGLLTNKVSTPMAAVIIAGMTPPLGLALAATLFPTRFDAEEREARGPALVLGLAFITEGAIPFAAKDPLRVIPALVAGSAVAGAISMVSGVGFQVPHGGVFAALIPSAVTGPSMLGIPAGVAGLAMFAIAVIAGTLVTAGSLFLLKKPAPVAETKAVPAAAAVRA